MLPEELKQKYPDKLQPEDEIFGNIHRGDRILISTGCGEPQHLIRSLINYVDTHPKAFFDAEIIHVWTVGTAPYTGEKYTDHFRHNSFLIGDSTRAAINRGDADYTPIFLSQIPGLFQKGFMPVDIALIQTSPPDERGYVSLGVSVDIMKAAVESARVVIAQINRHMPRVHGDTFVHIDDMDYIACCDEPLLEYRADPPDDVTRRIGDYVARLVHDGDTIQVGYGTLLNAVLSSLHNKKHLGVHTELIGDGIVNLMENGIIDNSKKTINRGKTVATFCMGQTSTYRYIHDNPTIEFRTIDYTNDPLIIAQHENMTAINSGLEIDLTGQATMESIGKYFYSGIGGQMDFMRGASLAKGGRTILTLQSTAEGGKKSRIVPFLGEGTGVTLNRGDIRYVVTEYGIAHLYGKNIRERAMELIAIAHPDFRGWLIEEAKKHKLIYADQAFIIGKGGEYPEHLETSRLTKSCIEIMLRPIKISDEPLYKDFTYSLSEKSMFLRFASVRQDMLHERRQPAIVIDYSKEMAILAVTETNGREKILGIGQYYLNESSHIAEVAFAVLDEYQNKGIGTELLDYIMYLAKNRGLIGLTASVLEENDPMIHVFRQAGFTVSGRSTEGIYKLTKTFRD